MDARQERGLQIYKNGRISETPKGWIVPSQNGNGTYLVHKQGVATKCNCPDCELRGVKCKHQYAIDYYLEYEKVTHRNGSTTVKKTLRVTYRQDWKNYTKAQTTEVNMFDTLLSDLVKGVPEMPQTMGRPRLDLSEQFFCAVQKVYSQLSSRRAYSLYRNAEEREQIEKAPNYNSVNKFLNREDITPILQDLLIKTAMPLKSVETTFAPDSSGFRTSQFNQYAVEKYGAKKRHKWVKAHILIGTKTNVIASARITEETANDCPQFEPMVMEAHESGFDIKEIPADMGYLSRANYELAKGIGATAYIPFKRRTTDKPRGSLTWKKMYHYFQFNKEEFLEHYHQRSNVESAFNMIKMKFGDKLKSRNFTAQKNELLCKFIAHNIVVLIHEMHELGIKAEFR